MKDKQATEAKKMKSLVDNLSDDDFGIDTTVKKRKSVKSEPVSKATFDEPKESV